MRMIATSLVLASMLCGCSQGDMDRLLTYGGGRDADDQPASQSAPAGEARTQADAAPQPAAARPGEAPWCQNSVASDMAKARADGFDEATVQRMGANSARQCQLFTGGR